MPTRDTTDPMDLIYTPSEIATIGNTYLDNRRHNKALGIPIGLESIDQDFNPALPGELITVLGRPGSGKTGFMMRWARSRAQYILDNKIENRVVVYASWEQSIEELYAFNVAADEHISITDMARGEIDEEAWKKVMSAANKRTTLPLWFIGHSLARRRKRPNLTMETLAMALDRIQSWNSGKMQIEIIFTDYLQRMSLQHQPENKVIGTGEILNRAKDGALAFGCPWVMGVQAKREVDDRELPIPQSEDGQWSSEVEITSDKMLSVVRPRRYRKEGEMFGSMLVTGHCQMLVSILKQKLGKDNKVYWTFFDPEYNVLDELETRSSESGEE